MRIPSRGNGNQQRRRQGDEQRLPYPGSSDLSSPRSGRYHDSDRTKRYPQTRGVLLVHDSSSQRDDEIEHYPSINSDGGRQFQQQYAASHPGDPPPYSISRAVDNQQGSYAHRSDHFYGDECRGVSHHQQNTIPSTAFRPLALPQITYGEGQPFFRGYSELLQRYDISRTSFIDTIDAVNAAIIPNPEMQILQQGANIAGWFVPGAASLGVTAGKYAIMIGSGFGHAAMINKVLAKSNLTVFVPRGLEICIGSSNDLDNEVGGRSYIPQLPFNASPTDRVTAYGDLLAPLDEVLPPAQNNGRRDPIAMIGKGLGKRQNQRKSDRAEKKLARGRTEKTEDIERDLKWLIVRQASDQAVGEWLKVLQKSDQDLDAAQAQSQTHHR